MWHRLSRRSTLRQAHPSLMNKAPTLTDVSSCHPDAVLLSQTNPSFRTYEYSTGPSKEVLDYSQYRTNFTEANLIGSPKYDRSLPY